MATQKGGGDSSEDSSPATATFKLQTNLILTRFHVVHRSRYVDTVNAEDIRITQDGRLQQLAVFEGPESTNHTVPVEIIILLDISLSTVNPGLLNGRFLKETILDGLGSHVYISVYGFANRIRRFVPPTRNVQLLEKGIAQTVAAAHGGTRLYQAISTACRQAAKDNPNFTRVILVFSDGFDTTQTKVKAALETAKELDYRLYPVILGHQRLLERAKTAGQRGRQAAMNSSTPGQGPFGNKGNRGEFSGIFMPSRDIRQAPANNYHLDWERRMEEFAELGEKTRGRSFDPPGVNAASLRAILEIIVDSVRSEYVAGYYPAAGLEDGKHKVKVSLLSKSLGKIHGGEKEFFYGEAKK